MIVAIAAGLALVSPSAGSSHSVALEPKAACRLAMRDRIPVGRPYSIRGTYFADGMHGSSLELPRCHATISPQVEGAARARIEAFHGAFAEKCGGRLFGDHISGVFTGRFVRRSAKLHGMPAPTMVNIFVITGLETSDEDLTSITCPK
jgi:hypothetical protein